MEKNELSRKTVLSLKKAAGTLAKVESMIGRGEPCVAVVQQMDAAVGLIQAARKKLVAARLEECLRRSSGGKAGEDFREIMRLYEVTRK
jgi:DNA-binding FrmR family transcriptional regulator